ncbi:MAG TPA: GAF domain-containing protein [Trebonia sp.]|jgi:signal transduction histidine kinase|nr:GAF domain-containing protein [Trebonia sp.]
MAVPYIDRDYVPTPLTVRDSDDAVIRAASRAIDSTRTFDAMLSVSRAVAAGGSLGEILDVIAAAAASVVVGATAASIIIGTGGTDELRLRGSFGLPPEYRAATEQQPELFRRSASDVAIRLGQPVLLDEIEANRFHPPGWHELWRQAGIRSVLATPLRVGESIIGVLCLYRSKPGGWTDLDVNLAQFFSDHAASATHTASLMVSMSDQVSALERVLRGLREQNHEHANRLHALHGLLALGAHDDAMKFLTGLTDKQNLVTANVEAAIHHPALAGLLVAESAIASQRGVQFSVVSGPAPISVPSGLDDAQLVTIVGNLLDNAFDAVVELGDERREVEISIISDTAEFHVHVRDRGLGLARPFDELRAPGVSTKPDHVGAGLALVDRIVTAVGGTFSAASSTDGTTFTVSIPIRTGAVT